MSDEAPKTVTIDVFNVPELVHGVMRSCAAVLREEADAEIHSRTAQRLREIAAAFEAGGKACVGEEASRNWLIYDRRTECFWGPDRRGYFKSIVDAGLYSEAEAKAAEDFANRYDRQEVAVPLEGYREQILRLAKALPPV